MPTHTPTTVTGPGAPALTPADISAISTPTSQPTEFVPTLETLDRVFEDTDDTRAAREALVTRHIAPLITDARVVAASRAVPRHSFVPTSQFASAYIDYALPIGYGQTISQPSLVAMMTEYLDLQAGERVLEIGTGSGYQAAMLRELTDAVYSVEIIPELASTARTVLDRMGYADIHLDRRDGYFGWAEHAPYDAIIVTAAPDHLPAPLVAQLNPDGGRMVIPIGPVGNVQTLWLVTRSGDDAEMERLLEVRFVPFTRE
ncbi:MAG: protein-L-isoaspartate(D-aspartate) O-methyltransferase [Anaerolineae bacterium]|nr:protein-L-isoaspartate(D-aspartate) O-methyltransferase [Anaerolineae bacterium]